MSFEQEYKRILGNLGCDTENTLSYCTILNVWTVHITVATIISSKEPEGIMVESDNLTTTLELLETKVLQWNNKKAKGE